MATVAPPPPREQSRREKKSGGFRGGDRKQYGGGGEGDRAPALPDRRYHTGMMIALAAIIMFFTALTSAYIVNKGLSENWQPVRLPSLLWINTALLAFSSLTLERARSSLGRFRNWWFITTLLGVAFLIGQLVVWRELAAQGVYLDTNPSSSFFYVLSGAHGIHLLGGVLALTYIAAKSWGDLAAGGHVAVRVTALYWHFMDGLWIYLFFLLLLWR